MEFKKSKIVIKPSGNGKYKTTWVYIPSKVANDKSFPFKEREEVLLEIKNDSIVLSKDNKRSRLIKEYGTDNVTLPKLLMKKAKENSGQIILIFGEDKFTFKEINEKSNQFAWGILEEVEKLKLKSPKFSLMMRNSPDFLFTWFGIVKSGCIFVPINTALKGQYLEHVIDDSDTEILIIDYEFLKEFENLRNNLSKIKKVFVNKAPENFEFNEYYFKFQSLRNLNRENPSVNIFDNDPIQIMYTEGITGRPKGVVYRKMLMQGINIGYRLKKIGFEEETKIYCPIPLFRAVAQFYVIIPSLFYNIPVVLANKFNTQTFWKDVRKHKPDVFTYFGGYLLFLLNNPPSKFDGNHSIKWAYGFGAGLEIWKSFENRFGISLHECWSHIEGIGITINTIGKKGGKMGSVGKPLKDIDIKILDSKGNELSSGTDNIGEIFIKSRNYDIIEYYKIPEFTDVKISKDNWISTGDFGYLDDDKYLYYMGKKNEIIHLAGEKIYLKEIERIANSHPSIYISLCVPLIGKPKHKTDLILYVVKMTDSSITPKKLNDFLYHNIAYHHVPRYIGFLDNLPLNPKTEYLKNEILNEWDSFIGERKIWDGQIQDYLD